MVNNIISKAPTREEYEKLLKTIRLGEAPGETKQTIERLEQLITVLQTKVAVRLKELFLAGYLPLLTSLSKINFKSILKINLCLILWIIIQYYQVMLFKI